MGRMSAVVLCEPHLSLMLLVAQGSSMRLVLAGDIGRGPLKENRPQT